MRRNPRNKAIPKTKTRAALALTHVGWRWLGGSVVAPQSLRPGRVRQEAHAARTCVLQLTWLSQSASRPLHPHSQREAVIGTSRERMLAQASASSDRADWVVTTARTAPTSATSRRSNTSSDTPKRKELRSLEQPCDPTNPVPVEPGPAHSDLRMRQGRYRANGTADDERRKEGHEQTGHVR